MEIGAAKAAARASGKAFDLEKFKGYNASNKLRLYSGAFKRYIAELLLSDVSGYTDEAEYWITKAIETDRTNGMMLSVAHDYSLYAEWLNRKGDRLQARETLGMSIEIFRECGAEGWAEKYAKEMAALL